MLGRRDAIMCGEAIASIDLSDDRIQRLSIVRAVSVERLLIGAVVSSVKPA